MQESVKADHDRLRIVPIAGPLVMVGTKAKGMAMGSIVEAELLDALARSDLDDAAKNAVLALLDDSSADAPVDPLLAEGRLFLSQISVKGFRGIGPSTQIDLSAERGLTLIVGANGSGKSSFAEAVERVLTGTVERWATATVDGKENWRNVGSGDRATVAVELRAERGASPFTLAVEWGQGDDLPGGKSTVRRKGLPTETWDPARWRAEISSGQPLLPYSSLRRVIDGKPSELFDAFNALLGLGALKSLDDQLREREVIVKGLLDALRDAHQAMISAAEHSGLVEIVALLPDLRRRTASPDSMRVALQVPGAGSARSAAPALPFALLLPIQADDVVDDLAAIEVAQQSVDDHAGASAERAERLADLLQRALDLHEPGTVERCPVCRAGTLDDAWRTDATGARDAQRQASAALSEARTTLRSVTNRLVDLLPRERLTATDLVPSAAALIDGLSTTRHRLADVAVGAPGACVDDLVTRFVSLAELVDQCRAEAQEALDDLAARKEPVDAAFARWSAAHLAAGGPRPRRR